MPRKPPVHPFELVFIHISTTKRTAIGFVGGRRGEGALCSVETCRLFLDGGIRCSGWWLLWFCLWLSRSMKGQVESDVFLLAFHVFNINTKKKQHCE